MPYTLIRSGTILTVLVTHPKLEDVPRGLAEILKSVELGGIEEVHVGFDESAWETGWARGTLTAFESSMRNLGVAVRVLGNDARLEPLKSK